MKVLDIGCGKNKYKSKGANVIGLDNSSFDGVDIVWDLEKTPLPFRNNEFDMIIASHILEHIHNLVPLMEELHRILKPNGLIKIRVPYWTHPASVMDVTHCRFFAFRTFEFFEARKPNFKIVNGKIVFSMRSLKPLCSVLNLIVNCYPIFYERFFAHILPCSELQFELKAKK